MRDAIERAAKAQRKMIEKAQRDQQIHASQIVDQDEDGSILPPGGIGGAGYPPKSHMHDEDDLSFAVATQEELDAALALLANYQELSEKNQDNGYAGLDGDGLVPITHLPLGSTSAPGIVEFAENGVAAPEVAVQADDDRLSDARTPTDHNHTGTGDGGDLSGSLISNYTDWTEQGSNLSNPTAGRRRLFAKNDGFYQRDSAGTVSKFSTIDGSGAANRIAIWSDADTLASDSGLSYPGYLNLEETDASTGVYVLQNYNAIINPSGAWSSLKAAIYGIIQSTGSGTPSGGASLTGMHTVVSHGMTGTIPTVKGVYTKLYNADTGGITSAYGIHVDAPETTGSGIIATLYGLYLAAQKTAKVTNAYGIYQAGASDLNYFAGPILVGLAARFDEQGSAPAAVANTAHVYSKDVATVTRMFSKDSAGTERQIDLTTFLELTDTPASYTSQASKLVQVNSGATALEFLTAISDTQHGSRSGGSLHSTATSGTAGFMSSTDKALIDRLSITSGKTVSFGVSHSTGTSFPGSPVSGDLCWRTDRSLLYYYDGTRWLTTNEYIVGITDPRELQPWANATVPVKWTGALPHRGYSAYITGIETTYNIGAPSAGNTWTLTYQSFTYNSTATTLGSAITTSTTAGTITDYQTPNTVLDTSGTGASNVATLRLTTATTGAPGTATVRSWISFRLVG